jgi:response regulator RpfG family c-di-GMP phosphodiesterase
MAAFSMPKSESEFKEWLLELVQLLDAIIEEKDALLRSHSKRVANNCANFCEEFKKHWFRCRSGQYSTGSSEYRWCAAATLGV